MKKAPHGKGKKRLGRLVHHSHRSDDGDGISIKDKKEDLLRRRRIAGNLKELASKLASEEFKKGDLVDRSGRRIMRACYKLYEIKGDKPCTIEPEEVRTTK